MNYKIICILVATLIVLCVETYEWRVKDGYSLCEPKNKIRELDYKPGDSPEKTRQKIITLLNKYDQRVWWRQNFIIGFCICMLYLITNKKNTTGDDIMILFIVNFAVLNFVSNWVLYHVYGPLKKIIIQNLNNNSTVQ